MGMHTIGLLITAITFCFFSCNKGLKPAADPVIEYGTQKYGDGVSYDYNDTMDYVIISKPYENRRSDPFPTLRFEVLKVDSMEVIFNDNIRGGKVSWTDNYIFRADGMKGIPGPDGEVPKAKSYSYNVLTRDKIRFLKRKYK